MKTIFSIPGMHCESCVSLIKEVSSDFPSIQKLDVQLETKKVEIEHAESFDKNLWIKEVEGLGDTYKVQKVS
ncbi:MAG: heavy-metal-associated domain-containing protein [Patescibacteria group bacterium]|mgnify:CR=1 FL=1